MYQQGTLVAKARPHSVKQAGGVDEEGQRQCSPHGGYCQCRAAGAFERHQESGLEETHCMYLDEAIVRLAVPRIGCR